MHDVLMLDIMLVTPKLRDVWNTRESLESEFGPICVVSKKGLVKLKSFRNSARDREEIRELGGRYGKA